MEYDFGGWATVNDVKCSDGRTIRRNAFEDDDGVKVPLVWNHQHSDPFNVLGHAVLENRKKGMYAYCSFNGTDKAQAAKQQVIHGDITALSIWANDLKQRGGDVLHGCIREVSLVMAGANPKATIESILAHGEETDEAVIYTGMELELAHAVSQEDLKNIKDDSNKASDPKDDSKKEKTVGEVFDTLNEEQKNVVYALIGQALTEGEEDEKDTDDEEDDTVKHNLFENDNENSNENVLSHSDMEAIINDGKRYGTLKESAIAHGIEEIDMLFPDERPVTPTPGWIERDRGWVPTVMNGVHHTPFSRIKSLFADITGDEARARGYIKGNLKVEEVFSLLKRTTNPTTIYKKQKLDRDDVVDITDFDVVAWLKSEMRWMLDEEIARAILIGDGRLASSDDKINEQNIRPIMSDEDLYTIKVSVAPASDSDDDIAKAFIRQTIKARKDYKGSGNPSLFTTEDMLINCLLLTDEVGRDLYVDEAQLAKKLRVKNIITVPVMENQKGPNGGDLLGLIVNLSDYNVGADKGGAVNLFDDFDIDYNAQKYLIETRCSGALIKPYSAIVLERGATNSSSTDGGDGGNDTP